MTERAIHARLKNVRANYLKQLYEHCSQRRQGSAGLPSNPLRWANATWIARGCSLWALPLCVAPVPEASMPERYLDSLQVTRELYATRQPAHAFRATTPA